MTITRRRWLLRTALFATALILACSLTQKTRFWTCWSLTRLWGGSGIKRRKGRENKKPPQSTSLTEYASSYCTDNFRYRVVPSLLIFCSERWASQNHLPLNMFLSTKTSSSYNVAKGFLYLVNLPFFRLSCLHSVYVNVFICVQLLEYIYSKSSFDISPDSSDFSAIYPIKVICLTKYLLTYPLHELFIHYNLSAWPNMCWPIRCTRYLFAVT